MHCIALAGNIVMDNNWEERPETTLVYQVNYLMDLLQLETEP